MPDVVLLDAVRSPLGAVHGGLAGCHPVALLAATLRGLERTGIDLDEIGDVIAGCVEQVGGQGGNVARAAVLTAGWPPSAGGMTVERGTVSGLAALAQAVAAVRAGAAQAVVAAAVDVPSLVPPGAAAMGRYPYGRPWEGAVDRLRLLPPGRAAEALAIARDRQDGWAARSLERACAAQSLGHFTAEIVTVAGLHHDELPAGRGFTAPLAEVPPLFDDDGTLTAANTAPDADGAAAVLVADAAWAEARSLAPLAVVSAWHLGGGEPDDPVGAAVHAARLVTQELGDVHSVELCEPSAAVTVALLDRLDLGALAEFVNPSGGGLALGEPAATAGLRGVVTLAHRLRRESLEQGLALGAGLGCGAAVGLRGITAV
jgi:acetyl-CoA acetyltransferase family protein